MADALWKLAFAVKSFGATHFLRILFDGIHNILYFCQTTDLVVGNGFTKLLETKFHVVEVWDDFTKLFRNVS